VNANDAAAHCRCAQATTTTTTRRSSHGTVAWTCQSLQPVAAGCRVGFHNHMDGE